ncbi:carboxypeptidase-like regulatory domain-containing protein, partial [bacterium]|nr:carboxypeptidase-like regulatory domain-containing protein [bacterium]
GEQGEFSITLPSLPSVGSGGNLSLYEYKIIAGIGEGNDRSSVRSVTKKIELVPGQTVNVTLILPNQTGVIKGRVTDSSGAPIEHTGVLARHHRYGVFQASTDADGVYEFGRSGDGLTGTQFLPEGVYDLEFVGPGNPVQHGALYQVKTGTLNADVVLTSKVWRVTGGVIDAESREPLHQFGIYIEYAPLAERAQPYFKTLNLNSYDGTYEVPFFETGRYRLRFYADGYEPQAGLITVLEDSKEVQPLNVELKKSETMGSIQGVFVSTSGSQLGKVEVAGIGVFPAQNNQFLIENLPPGQHDLVFYLFETASQSYIPIGVLTSVTVQAGGRTQIGPVTAANLQTRYVNP